MAGLDIKHASTFEEFVRIWHDLAADNEITAVSDDDTRLLWQLLGQLDEDEVLVRIPQWLAEEKAGYSDGAPPTEVVGRIERETEKAILLDDTAAARPLMRLAHRIDELESTENATERDAWLDRRLAKHRRAFETREDVPGLSDEWLPKSQLERVVRRRDE